MGKGEQSQPEEDTERSFAIRARGVTIVHDIGSGLLGPQAGLIGGSWRSFCIGVVVVLIVLIASIVLLLSLAIFRFVACPHLQDFAPPEIDCFAFDLLLHMSLAILGFDILPIFVAAFLAIGGIIGIV